MELLGFLEFTSSGLLAVSDGIKTVARPQDAWALEVEISEKAGTSNVDAMVP